MDLQSILEMSRSAELAKNKRPVMTEDYINKNIDTIRESIAFFRWYPDLFIDYIKGEDCKFKFYFYQRVFLRAVMRHRYIYAVFPRAYSKSFLTMMALMIRCILYPGVHLFITSGGKEQAASITIAKVEEICSLIPALSNELNLERGVTKHTKDDVKYVFKNGSIIDILPARDSSRGQRRNGGSMEECILIDGDILNEIIIPTMNVDRNMADGTHNPKELVNRSQVYITTAGFKNSFAYRRLIELLVQSIIEPDEVMILGGTWKTPVKEGLLQEDFVDQLRLQGTFNEQSFGREYESVWAGDSENSFFSSEIFDRNRTLNQPEYEYSNRSTDKSFYVIGVDVGRFSCTTEACIFKVTPHIQNTTIKTLVNCYSIDKQNFEEQAIALKKLYYKYKARVLAIDANGVGAGLVDFMTTTQIDPDTGAELPPFGIAGGTNESAFENYKKIKGGNVEENAMYLIKADAPLNTEAYSYAQVQMSSNRIKFLKSESEAKTKLMTTKLGKDMTADQRNIYLRPFVLTSVLKEEMMNLVSDNEGQNIILKQSAKKIPKDRFSAFIYGLYYIKQEEDKLNRRRKRNVADYMFYN